MWTARRSVSTKAPSVAGGHGRRLGLANGTWPPISSERARCKAAREGYDGRQPVLRKIGIEIGFGREGRARTRTINITTTTTPSHSAPENAGAQPSAPSASSASMPKSNSANGFAAPPLRTVANDADGSGGGHAATVRTNPFLVRSGVSSGPHSASWVSASWVRRIFRERARRVARRDGRRCARFTVPALWRTGSPSSFFLSEIESSNNLRTSGHCKSFLQRRSLKGRPRAPLRVTRRWRFAPERSLATCDAATPSPET
jgi:hypothetical protein